MMANLVELWTGLQALTATRPWLFAVVVIAVMITEGLIIALTLEGALRLFVGSRQRFTRSK